MRIDNDAVFENLYTQIGDLLGRFGEPDTLIKKGAFCVHGDYWGHPQIKASFHDLKLLHPDVIGALQRLIAGFPGWEIVIAVAVRGHYDDWPDMGLIVRSHEIVDGLQRQYFPREFQRLQYPNSRRGTERD